MIKTFVFGVVLGIGLAAAGLHAIPLVDQHRELSRISVAPNGGNRETFHINIPDDRLLIGSASESTRFPADIEWPENEILGNFGAEVFKLRNADDIVVGIAARTAGKEDDSENVDWVLHLPARGSLFINMDSLSGENEQRIGRLRTGTREFRKLTGFVAELWLPDNSGEADSLDGRIELRTNYVGQAEASQ